MRHGYAARQSSNDRACSGPRHDARRRRWSSPARDRRVRPAHLECERERSDRPLSGAAGRQTPRHRSLVVVSPPEQLANFSSQLAGYLPHRVPLLKHVLALPGQTICRDGFTITVDVIEMGKARQVRRSSSSFAHLARVARWSPLVMVFLMNWESANSFDRTLHRHASDRSRSSAAPQPLWTSVEE